MHLTKTYATHNKFDVFVLTIEQSMFVLILLLDVTSDINMLSPFRGGGGGGLRTPMTRIAMLTGVLILLVGPPKQDRLNGRCQTK